MQFDAKYPDIINNYYNEIAKQYLNKPNFKLTYNFIVFEKVEPSVNSTHTKYIPFIFNIRELKSEHKPILERIKYLITHEIPKK